MRNANEASLDAVCRFVSEAIGLPPGEIRPDRSLRSELGVDGDDAVELLAAFEERFSCDLTGFPFHRYFAEEGFAVPLIDPFLRRWLGLPPAPRGRPDRRLTVRDLVRLAN